MNESSPPSDERDGRPPEGARAGPGAAPPSARRWPQWLRRGSLEMAACTVIALGIFMMLQPFALLLFTWSFATTLAGVVMLTVVSKFPE